MSAGKGKGSKLVAKDVVEVPAKTFEIRTIDDGYSYVLQMNGFDITLGLSKDRALADHRALVAAVEEDPTSE